MTVGTAAADGRLTIQGSGGLRVAFAVCLAACASAAGLAYLGGGLHAALPIGAVGVAVLVGAVLVEYRLGVCLLPLAILISPEFGAGLVRVRLEDLLLPLVLLGWFVRTVGAREGWARTPLNGLILVLLLSGFASTSLGIFRGTIPQPPLGFFFLFKRVQYLLLFFLALQAARDREWARWMVGALLVGFAVTAAVGLYQRLAFGPEFIVSGVRPGERATFAAVLVLLISVCVGMAVVLRVWWHRLALLAVGLVAAVPLLYTYSRGAYVGMLAALAFLGLRRSRALLVGVALLVIFASAVLPEEVHERASTIAVVFGAPERTTQSWAARVGAWHVVLSQVLSQPLVGYGMGALPLGWIDNELIKELYYGGVVGLVLYALVLVGLWRMGASVAHHGGEVWVRAFASGFLAGFVGSMVQSITATNLTAIRSAGLFWLTAGIVAGLYVLCRQQRTGEQTA
jgi:O-antigen ligase